MPTEETIQISKNEFLELQSLADLFRTKLEKISAPVKKKKVGLTEDQKARLRMLKNKSIVKP